MIHRRNLLLAGAGLALAPLGQASSAALGRDNPIVDAFVKEQGFNGVAMLDTVYGVASISKWLTAATVLKLVEAGKLSLDAPITTWTCSPTSCLGGHAGLDARRRFPEAREHVILATKSG